MSPKKRAEANPRDRAIPHEALQQLYVACMAFDDATRPCLSERGKTEDSAARYMRLCREGHRYSRGFRGSLFAAVGADVAQLLGVPGAPGSGRTKQGPNRAGPGTAKRSAAPADAPDPAALFLEFGVALSVLVDAKHRPELQAADTGDFGEEWLARWLQAALDAIDFARYQRARAFWRGLLTAGASHGTKGASFAEYAKHAPFDEKRLNSAMGSAKPYASIVRESEQVAAAAHRLLDQHAREEELSEERIEAAWARIEAETAREIERYEDPPAPESALLGAYAETLDASQAQRLRKDASHGSMSRESTGMDRDKVFRVTGAIVNVATSVHDSMADELKEEVGTIILEGAISYIAEKALLVVAPKIAIAFKLARWAARIFG